MLVCPVIMLPTPPTPNLSERKCRRRRGQVLRKNQFFSQNRANSAHPGNLGLTLDSDRNFLRDYSRNSWEAGSKSLAFCSQCSYSMKHPGHLGMVLPEICASKRMLGSTPSHRQWGFPLFCVLPPVQEVYYPSSSERRDTP